MNENELMSSLPVPKAVAKMAIPSVMSSLVTVVYNMADTFFCRTDRRSAAGGGSQPDKPDLYTVYGICQHVWNGLQCGCIHGDGREK